MQSETKSNPTTTAEKLQEQQAAREQGEGIAKERAEDYKKAINGVVSTPNGELVMKAFVKALGVFAVKPNRDGMALVSDKALRDFYLTFIRPYLDEDLRRNIEN
jgi:hypothetical protein